ncbi:MAG TPA: cupin domain-containing protein [Bryobacteraceae bacterium]|nr:cupin domain-containing protein [Bryobacteraceae bacterium]
MKLTDLDTFLNDSIDLPRTTTLFRENGLRAVLFYLKSGEGLPEHHTAGAITVQCLKGHALFSAGGERVPLKPNWLLSLAPGVSHSLIAHHDTLLLVTISEQIRTEAA